MKLRERERELSPKKDPINKHSPQMARTAFGKRQPKDESDLKKHPNLDCISTALLSKLGVS
jgi:hypothetical protein